MVVPMDEPRPKSRWEQYRELRRQGHGVAKIAAAFGVTKSAVKQALAQPEVPPEIVREDGTPCPCHYCGVSAQAVDVVRRAVAPGRAEAYEARMPACRECRTLAAASRERWVEARKTAVKSRLRAMYGHRLAVPDWSERELAGLSPELRGYVTRSMHERDALKDRLAW